MVGRPGCHLEPLGVSFCLSFSQKGLQVYTWQLGSGAGCFLLLDSQQRGLVSFPALTETFTHSQQASES